MSPQDGYVLKGPIPKVRLAGRAQLKMGVSSIELSPKGSWIFGADHPKPILAAALWDVGSKMAKVNHPG